MGEMGATEKLAQFAAAIDYDSLPEEVVTAVKRTVLDTLAVSIAGCREEAAAIIAAYVQELSAAGEAGVVGSGFQTAASEAALANGTLAHALDYDDVSTSMLGHPSAPLLPAVLAVAEKTGVPGKDVIVAFVVGLEVECKLGLAIGASHYARGWHPTATLGTLGAAVACTKLLCSDVAAIRAALGIATSLAGGSRQNFGTMSKPLHAGIAARNGVMAASLAVRGFSADASIIEAPLGFLHLFGVGGHDAERAMASLGQPFDIISPGIGVKLYPCCYESHRALDAALQLRKEANIEAPRIARVEARVSPGTATPLIHHRPQTGLEGKFSMEYCLAAALLDGKINLASFADEAVQRPQAQELLRRVEMVEEEQWQPIFGPATVTVILDDGSQHSRRVETPGGDPRAPLTWEELVAKYRDCAAGILPDAATARSAEIIANLEAAADVGELMGIICLTAPQAQAASAR
jgi:2-methylcitrate dehydratase PrpD